MFLYLYPTNSEADRFFLELCTNFMLLYHMPSQPCTAHDRNRAVLGKHLFSEGRSSKNSDIRETIHAV